MSHSPGGIPASSPEVRTALPHPNPAVVFCEVEEGAVLLSTTEEVYYGLNPVGARIWSLLTSPNQSLESLCAALAADYPEVDAEALQADVALVLDDLLRNQLVLSV